MGWKQIREQWGLVEFTFLQVLGVDLEDAKHTQSWRWFASKLRVLLITSNPLADHFAEDDPEPEQVADDGG